MMKERQDDLQSVVNYNKYLPFILSSDHFPDLVYSEVKRYHKVWRQDDEVEDPVFSHNFIEFFFSVN
jgi:hypothetical protein